MEPQAYRAQIAAAIRAADATAVIIDPLAMGATRRAELAAESTADPWADDAHVKRMFADVVAAAADCDVNSILRTIKNNVERYYKYP